MLLIRASRVLVLLGLVALASCTSPLDRSQNEELREMLQNAYRAHLDAIGQQQVELTRETSEVEKELLRGTKEDPDRNKDKIKDLDKVSGPSSYRDSELIVGYDLLEESDDPIVEPAQPGEGNPPAEAPPADGEDQVLPGQAAREVNRVRMTLLEAVQTATRNNIDLQIAQLVPAIRRTQVTQALAAFDATFFTNADFSWTDTPQPTSNIPGFGGPVQAQNHGLETGIRKPLTTGGGVVLSTGFTSNWDDSLASRNPNPYWDANLTLSVSQPLLRGFGAEINKAEIILRRSARKQSVEELRANLIEVINAVESAYWNLFLAKQNVLIRQRLLDQTRVERRRLGLRLGFDVEPATYTEVLAREETRRLEVIQGQRALRQASDDLKRLLNDPKLPLSGETLILPLDTPPDLPLKFSLLDTITTALQFRPEIRQALMQIKDASVRQRVADNGRLPVLDLNATLAYKGLDEQLDGAYRDLGDAHYIDYILGLQFETPIGNRGPEAAFRQRQLERQQAVLNYQRAAQDVVLEVKSSLRNLTTAYILIGVTRSSRRAAAESLRALIAKEEAGTRLSPEFIDLKLRRQESLAAAEQQEIEALTGYQRTISNLYRATGTLLKRNNIQFDDAPGE